MWYYQNGYYWGMNWIWWLIWFVLLIWIFAIPLGIPGQRYRKDGPLDLLKKRFANGEIDQKEYLEKKEILEKK